VDDKIVGLVRTQLESLQSALDNEIQSRQDQTPTTISSIDQAQLQTLVQNSETLTRTVGTQAIDWQQSFTSLSNQLDSIQAAYASLEDRYENISTDDLHQRMVRWFTTNYPTAQNILDILGSVQQELLSFRDFTKKTHWLIQNQDSLSQLARVATEVTDMVRNFERY
jgi:hypothetical protein